MRKFPNYAAPLLAAPSLVLKCLATLHRFLGDAVQLSWR
jgi:hypothetical protein